MPQLARRAWRSPGSTRKRAYSPALWNSRPSSLAAVKSLVGVGPAVSARGGTGAMAAVQLDPSDPTLAPRVAMAVRKAGVITRAIAGNGLQVSPPLIFSPEHIEEMVEGLRTGLASI